MSEVRTPNNVMKFAFQATQKAVENEDGFTYIKGIASTENKDRHGDVIPMSLWTKEVLDAFMKSPVLLNGHNHSDIAGVVTSLSVGSDGLEIEAKIFNEHTQKNGLKTSTLIENNALKGLSISFITRKWDFDSKDGDYVWIAEDIELLEISLVAVGANADATFSVQKSLGEDYETFKAKHINKNKMNILQTLKDFFSSASPEEQAELKSLVAEKTAEENEDDSQNENEGEGNEENANENESNENNEGEQSTDNENEGNEKSALELRLDALEKKNAELEAALSKKNAKPVKVAKDADPNPTENIQKSQAEIELSKSVEAVKKRIQNR